MHDDYLSPFDGQPQFSYENTSHLANPSLPAHEQEREVRRVLAVSQDPETAKPLPPELIPENVIKSRLGNAVWGDSCAFKPTCRELMVLMECFLQNLSAICALHLGSNQYLIQSMEASHFAFAGVTPPGTRQAFLTAKAQQFAQPDAWAKLVHDLQAFLDRVQPHLRFKEIKLNPDGHIVLRMTVEPSQAFVSLADSIGALFTTNYQRYAGDLEKKTTLACVLGVINLQGCAAPHRAMVMTHLQNMFDGFRRAMHAKAVPFDRIDWVEWTNRFFNAKDLLGRLSVTGGFVRLSPQISLRDLTPCASQSQSLACVHPKAKNMPEACLTIRETLPDKNNRKYWQLVK